MATVYCAKWILQPNGKILENGGISVVGNAIGEVGPRGKLSRTSRDNIVNLGEMLLIPGMINMHSHFEEGLLRGFPKGDEETFASWRSRRHAMLVDAGADAVISTARLGIRESLANGITTVVDSTTTDIPPIVLREEPIRSWVMHEVDPPDPESEEDLLPNLEKRVSLSRRTKSIGLSPYALYSLKPESHRKIIEIARANDFLWASHVAESAEELQAFSELDGQLYSQITASKPWEFGTTHRGSLHYAVTNNIIPNYGICIHCNYAGGQELSLLAVKNVSIVLCPQYSSSLGHMPFPLDVALNRGINVCVGTESPASSRPMNLLDELFQLKQSFPHISASQALDMITVNPARALRCFDTLGTLENGKKADIVGVRFPHSPKEDLLEEMIEEKAEIAFVLVDGDEVIFGG